MRTLIAWGIGSLLVVSTSFAQEPAEFPTPQKEHEFLQRFVGEWESESKMALGEGQPDMHCKGTIKARMLGGFWVVSEIQSEMMGTPVKGLQTIGYDPKSKKYVGTWVDSMLSHLWKLEGSVDDTGEILTLEAEGPSFFDTGKQVRYRDIFEFRSRDHIVTTSQMQDSDGKWSTFMTGNARRKRAE